MSNQSLLIQTINEQLLAAQALNSRYSLRAMAKRLDLSISTLSEIRRGKRKITTEKAAQIADRLHLSPEQRASLLKPSKAPEYLELSSEQFQAIADWEHFALLALIKTKTFRYDEEWISGELSLPISKVRAALKRLQKLGLIEIKDRKIRRTTKSLTTSDEVASLAIRKSHLEDMDLIKSKILSVPLELRDSTSVTMAIDPSKLPEAKKLIRKFREELSTLLESGSQSEVYKFSMQLFPLSRSKP